MMMVMAANGYETEFIIWLKRHRYDYREVVGCYRGQQERSFMIYARRTGRILALLRKAKEYKQESVLFVKSNAISKLIFIKTGKILDLGKFRLLSKDQALRQEGYTYDPISDKYYVAA